MKSLFVLICLALVCMYLSGCATAAFLIADVVCAVRDVNGNCGLDK